MDETNKLIMISIQFNAIPSLHPLIKYLHSTHLSSTLLRSFMWTTCLNFYTLTMSTPLIVSPPFPRSPLLSALSSLLNPTPHTNHAHSTEIRDQEKEIPLYSPTHPHFTTVRHPFPHSPFALCTTFTPQSSPHTLSTTLRQHQEKEITWWR